MKITFFLPILAIWLLTHLFSLNWGLPANYEYAPDGIYPELSLNAESRMKMDLCRYPPLQFLLLDSFSTAIEENTLTRETRRELRSERILLYRTVCALMELGILLLIYGAGRMIGLSRFSSVAAAAMFQLTPCALFYSHTSNLDIPYTFWACCAFFAVLWSERNPRYQMLIRSLTGVLIAFAFCTKDQAYALFVLPTAFLIWKRYREKNDLRYALTPPVLWLIGFVPAVILIYAGVGGIETALTHFHFIFTDGRTPFHMVSGDLSGRIKLFGLHLLEFGPVLDWPLLCAFSVSMLLLLISGKFKTFLHEKKNLLIVSLLVFLSVHFLFNQATLSVYSRFLIPLIPFMVLILAGLSEKIRFGKIILAAVIVLQIFPAIQLLYNMKNCPQVQASRTGVSLLKKKTSLCTMTAEPVIAQGFTDGIPCRKKTIRSWSFANFDFFPYFAADLPPEQFFADLIAPEYILIPETTGKKLTGYKIEKRFDIQEKIPTFFRYKTARFCLLKRNPDHAAEKPDDDFMRLNISERMLRLDRARRCMAEITPDQMQFIRKALQPYSEPDPVHYAIDPETLHWAQRALSVKAKIIKK